MMDMQGSVALVTGATSGIGRATAQLLAARGASVLVSGRDVARGEATVAAIEASGGVAQFLGADLATVSGASDLAARALVVGEGRIDILVNNAGVFPRGATADFPVEDYDRSFAVNVQAPFVLVGAVAPRMAARGSGAIVNVGTMAAEFGIVGMAVYGATKAALNLLTKAWAAEYGPFGVRVNGVNPGTTLTEGTAPSGQSLYDYAAGAPIGRPAAPEEIAAAIAYLASDAASFVQGAVLAVDGGRTAS